MWAWLRGAVAWVTDHNLSAPAWSAIAAGFSALSSFMVMRIQRKNLLESARPELVLLGWTRETTQPADSPVVDVVGFNTIKNVGRGTAFSIGVLALNRNERDLMTAILVPIATNVPVLGAGGEATVDCHIALLWKQAVFKDRLYIHVRASCWDARGRSHTTRQELMILKPGFKDSDESSPLLRLPQSNEAAPGVVLTSRETKVRSALWHTLRDRLEVVPGLPWLFRQGDEYDSP